MVYFGSITRLTCLKAKKHIDEHKNQVYKGRLYIKICIFTFCILDRIYSRLLKPRWYRLIAFGIHTHTHTSFIFLKYFIKSSRLFSLSFSKSSFRKWVLKKIGFRFRKEFMQNIVLTLFYVDPWSHTGSIKSVELYFVFGNKVYFCRKKIDFKQIFNMCLWP